ncbi:MAG: peptide-methionine (R)-S-oxide reductase MsrB [Burkholderiaceae bacterium]|jgi:peptide-methionine (R)-S-oxide reductase
MKKTDADYCRELSDIEYAVTRKKATEPPFTGRYWDHFASGSYRCICCGQPLFDSRTKFDAGCGWPSYWQAISPTAIREERDTSHFMVRTEIVCSQCDAHLGHVFDDGPQPTGLRYCVNSASIRFDAADPSD